MAKDRTSTPDRQPRPIRGSVVITSVLWVGCEGGVKKHLCSARLFLELGIQVFVAFLSCKNESRAWEDKITKEEI